MHPPRGMRSFALSSVIFSLLTLALAASRPECFASGPACLQPQVSECRDALLKMRYTDPGFITTFGRHVQLKRNSIEVPRIWNSYPKNCAVKLDVVAEQVSDSFRLQTLTTQGEEVIRTCVTHGTGCGGIVNVGPKMVMQLTVGFYAAVQHSRLQDLEELIRNVSVSGQPHGVTLNDSHHPGNETAES